MAAETQESEMSVKEVILKIKYWIRYVISKWLIIALVAVLVGGIRYMYVRYEKPRYKAVLSFVVEEEKTASGFSGFASQFGMDGGGGGNAFTGNNLFVFMKSRTLVEKALLEPINFNGRELSLADMYIDFKGWKQTKASFKTLSFPVRADKRRFNIDQIRALESIFEKITSEDLFVGQNDKKVSIMTIEMESENELFSKVFVETLAREVSEFYVDTKSKKAKLSVAILEKQVDSIRYSLYSAITGVASAEDNIYNLNPAFNIKKVPSTKRQVDVQANTAILNQLLPSLEQAKVTLRKETPLIQILEAPILPLKINQADPKRAFIIGALFAALFTAVILVARRWIRDTLMAATPV